MNTIFAAAIDWQAIFTPELSLWEIIIRGTLTYWFTFLYLRFFRRSTGQLSIADVLLITLISDASQNAMGSEYKSVTEGVVLVGTLVAWDYIINWLGYRSLAFSKLQHPDPVLLVKDGQVQHDALKRQLLTEEELQGQLRVQGVDDVAQVKRCFMEGNGNISVIKQGE